MSTDAAMAAANDGAMINNMTTLPAVPARRLEGKVALITGGAGGIGHAIAELFYSNGAKIVVADLLENSALNNSPNFLYIRCDVTQESEVSAAISLAVSTFGTLDIMINNAGISGGHADIRELKLSDFRAVFTVNVDGAFLCTKHAARIMIPRCSGNIVNIASVTATMAGLAPHGYTASKHALLGLTRSTAAELGQYGVRVNCISPHAIPTPLALPLAPKEEGVDDLTCFHRFVRKSANLLGVDLEVHDIAEAALYLASGESKYVSGLNLVVDGGFTCVNHTLGVFRSVQ